MEYQDLQMLIDHDDSARNYFLSLPSRRQMQLLRHESLINTEEDLHRYAEFFSKLPPLRH